VKCGQPGSGLSNGHQVEQVMRDWRCHALAPLSFWVGNKVSVVTLGLEALLHAIDNGCRWWSLCSQFVRHGTVAAGSVTKELVGHAWLLPTLAECNEVFSKELGALSWSVGNHHCCDLGIVCHPSTLEVRLELLCEWKLAGWSVVGPTQVRGLCAVARARAVLGLVFA